MLLVDVFDHFNLLMIFYYILGSNGPVNIYYGIGGCLALPAQNGVNVDSATFAIIAFNVLVMLDFIYMKYFNT